VGGVLKCPCKGNTTLGGARSYRGNYSRSYGAVQTLWLTSNFKQKREKSGSLTRKKKKEERLEKGKAAASQLVISIEKKTGTRGGGGVLRGGGRALLKAEKITQKLFQEMEDNEKRKKLEDNCEVDITKGKWSQKITRES